MLLYVVQINIYTFWTTKCQDLWIHTSYYCVNIPISWQLNCIVKPHKITHCIPLTKRMLCMDIRFSTCSNNSIIANLSQVPLMLYFHIKVLQYLLHIQIFPQFLVCGIQFVTVYVCLCVCGMTVSDEEDHLIPLDLLHKHTIIINTGI